MSRRHASAALRRLGATLVVLWLAASLAFLMTCVLPADPARAVAGPHAPPAVVAAIQARFHLDRPVAEQYWAYLWRAAHLDLGTSWVTRRPVLATLLERLPASASLALAAIVLQVPLGLGLGLAGALRPGRLVDRLTAVLSLVAISGPAFVWGLLLVDLLGLRLGWFPIAGAGAGGLGDRLWHLVLPATTLAIGGVAGYARLARTELGTGLAEDWARTARAGGAGPLRVALRHALPNALLPLVALGGLDLGTLLGGAVIVESIFGWPGLGQLAVQAVYQLDLPMIVGTVLLTGVLLALANLAVDLVSPWLDPRHTLE